MDALSFNMRHLRAMAAIVATGRMGSAARAVNLTQPAVAQGIARMEAQIGSRLFDRRPDGMVPTAAASILTPRIEEAMRLIGMRHATGAQIRAYLALARAGGYAGAARATGLSEASLHRAVGDLSASCGQRLVERRGRGVALTPRGVSVARNFRLAVVELRSALAELSALQGHEVGRIVVGAMPLVRARLLPRVIKAFHKRHPQIDLAIVEGSHAELLAPLREGEIDLLLGALRPEAPDDIAQQPLFEDHLLIIARKGHPLTQSKTVSSDDLSGYPWIVAPPGTPLRTQWAAIFEEANVEPPRVPIECGSAIVIVELLVDTDFLAMLSIDQVSAELEAGRLIAIDHSPQAISRTIGVSTREGWRPTALQSRFIATLFELVGPTGCANE